MKRVWLTLTCLTFVAVFLWAYRTVIAPVYGYEGLIFNWPGIDTMLWVTVLILIPLAAIPLELSKPSVLIVWWLYVTVYVPTMLIPALTLTMPESTALPLQLSVLCGMLMLWVIPHAPTLVLPNIVVSPRAFWWAMATIWAVCLVILLDRISITRVLSNYAFMVAGGAKLPEYVVRSDFMMQVGQNGKYLGYVGRELAEAFDPFLIAYGLLSKRWWMLIIGIAGQLVYVGQTGMKEVPIAMLLILTIWALRRSWSKFGIVALLGITGLVGIAATFDLATDTTQFSTLITRRALAGPGQLTGYYFEHYTQVPHPGHHFSGTGSFQLYGPPQEIGIYYFHKDMDANANLWAEGFAEYGIPGIFGFTLVLVVSLWLFDSIAVRRSFELAVLLAVVQADALSNSSPLTILVTHGGILTALLIYFAPEADLSRWNKVEGHGPGQRWTINRVRPPLLP